MMCMQWVLPDQLLHFFEGEVIFLETLCQGPPLLPVVEGLLYLTKSNQIVFVTYTWLADVNASVLVLLVPTMQ